MKFFPQKRTKFNPFFLTHLCVYFSLMAAFYNSLIGVISKLLSSEMSSFEIVFFRNFFGLIIVIWVLFKQKDCNFFSGGHLGFLIFRGVIGLCGMSAFFYNIANTDLGTAFSLYKTAPVWTALIAAYFFGEKLSNLAWFAIILGFVGFAMIVQPQFGIKTTDIVGIVGGLCSGLALVSVHELRKYYSANTIVLSYMLSGSVIMGLVLLLGEFDITPVKFVLPSAKGWLYMGLIAVGGYLFQLYLTKSYAATRKAGIPAAIGYTEILFSLALGLLLGDKLPNLLGLCGICVIIISGILIAKEK